MRCTDYYEYDNINPKGKFGGDCVIRAIAKACNQSWEETIREMTELGIKMGFVAIDEHVKIKYLLNKGFRQMCEPRDVYNKKMSIKEWMKNKSSYFFKDITVVANVGSYHTTCIANGKIHDIWDCSGQTMHKYWWKGAK